jgi:hypothetical protein
MMNYLEVHSDNLDAYRCFQHRVTERDEDEGCLCQKCQKLLPGLHDTDEVAVCDSCQDFDRTLDEMDAKIRRINGLTHVIGKLHGRTE